MKLKRLRLEQHPIEQELWRKNDKDRYIVKITVVNRAWPKIFIDDTAMAKRFRINVLWN